jgi:hypothetical protein
MEKTKGAISYSLFDADSDNLDLRTYVRYFHLAVRMNQLIYPGWDNLLYVDESTYNKYHAYFNKIEKYVSIDIIGGKYEPCEAMLWRIAPFFDHNYTHVLSRDVDSITTYRERQMVEVWIDHDKTMHAITDHSSHNTPLLGGMIGARPKYWTMYTTNSYDEFMTANPFDFSYKGSDQEFLFEKVYKKVTSTITEHFMVGMPQSWNGDCHNNVPDIPVLPLDLKESNHLTGYIGQSGYSVEHVLKFLNKYQDRADKAIFEKIEREYPKIFYWWL